MSPRSRRSLERLEARDLLAADAQLSGIVWLDANQNTIWDLDEVGLAAVQVYLDLNGDGQLTIDEPATFTLADDPLTPENEAGYYEFSDLAPGEYQVRVVLEDGHEPTFPHAMPEMRNLIVNGSFETGLAGWTHVAGADGQEWLAETPTSTTHGTNLDGLQLFAPPSPRDGNAVAYHPIGSVGGPYTSSLYQEVDLTNTVFGFLQFQYRVQWNYEGPVHGEYGSEESQTFSYQIRAADDGEILFQNELAAITGDVVAGDTDWNFVVLPLDQFTGRKIEVVFVSDVVASQVLYSSIEVDAVEVLTLEMGGVSHLVRLGPGESQPAVDFGIYSTQSPNMPPQLTAPAQIWSDEDKPLAFVDLIRLEDADAAGQDLQVEISVDTGKLILTAAGGVTVLSGTASGDTRLLLQGDLTALQAAFDSLTFVPREHFHGSAALTVIANDLGHAGLGGTMSDMRIITLVVEPVNDLPHVARPIGPIVVPQGTTSQTVDISQLFSDVDIATSGDYLAIDVTGNTNNQLVTTAWIDGELVLSFAPNLAGTAFLTLTATDEAGGTAEFSLEVEVAAVAPSRLSLNLARPDALAAVGQVHSQGTHLSPIFHEWEDAAAELWITIQGDLPDGAFDLSWTAESSVSWISQAEVIGHLGSVATVSASSTSSGTYFQGQIVGLDLSGFNIGDRVLLATIRLPKDLTDPVGIPHDMKGAHTSATPHSGLTLTDAAITVMQQALVVEPVVPGQFLPVVFDADDNGAIGLSDFSQFVAAFGQTTDSEHPGAYRFDFDRNGRVGLSDFASFVRFFGTRKDSGETITVADLLGQEISGIQLSLEGERIGSEITESQTVTSAPISMSGEVGPFSACFTEARPSSVTAGTDETRAPHVSVPPVGWGHSPPLDPVVLDILWRDATWGWDDELDVMGAKDESLETEPSDWSGL